MEKALADISRIPSGAAILSDPLLWPIAGAIAQPSSEELMAGPRASHSQQWLPAMPAYAIPDQVVDLIPQDLEYADVIDARSDDRRSEQSSFDRHYSDAVNGIEEAYNYSDSDDLQPLLQQFEQRQVIPDRDAERQVFKAKLLQYLRDGAGKVITTTIAVDILRNIDGLYNRYQEKQFEKTTTDPAIQGMDLNQLQSRPIPAQCRRHMWIDGQGVLRSTVICNSGGDSRVYHER